MPKARQVLTSIEKAGKFWHWTVECGEERSEGKTDISLSHALYIVSEQAFRLAYRTHREHGIPSVEIVEELYSGLHTIRTGAKQ